MKLTIQHKFIVAFLGLTLLILTATLGLARWGFERGFLEYVNTIEQQRLEASQLVLAAEYERAGNSWDSLSTRRLDTLLREALPQGTPMAPGSAGQPRPRFEGRPRPPGGPGGPKPPGGPGRPKPGPPPYPPTAVYDLNGVLVAGQVKVDTADRVNSVAVFVGGEKVGELRSALRKQLVSPEEAAFSAQQSRLSWIIGVVAMVLALGVSILLARGMLAPVRRMMDDVSELSDGDYSVRIDSDRHDELGDLMRNLNRLAETLENSRESRRRWFADVSHELRTPVTVLTGELEALQDGIREFDQAQLESLMQEVQRLRYLIDDLYELAVSDVGGLRYEFSKIRLDDILGSAVEGAQKRATETGVEFSLNSVPVSVNGDYNRLGQLFQNLFANSLGYTDSPGSVDVSVVQSGTRAIVEIEDTPPGVSPEDCDKLFEPLYRREASRSRRTGGAGLGLAICRKIVEAHDGEITAAPSVRGGLAIRIELPVVNTDEP